MFKAGSKKDAVTGATRVKDAIILYRGGLALVFHLLTYATFIGYFYPPPANLSPQFQFVLSNARAENGKPNSAERFSIALVSTATGRERIASFMALYDKSVAVVLSPILEVSQKAKADKLTLGLAAR